MQKAKGTICGPGTLVRIQLLKFLLIHMSLLIGNETRSNGKFSQDVLLSASNSSICFVF